MSKSFSTFIALFLVLIASCGVNAGFSYGTCSGFSCDPGYGDCFVSSIFGVATCVGCPAGKYSAGGVGATCSTCPQGTYCPIAGSGPSTPGTVIPTNCTGNTVSNILGATSSSTCVQCNGLNVVRTSILDGSSYCVCPSGYGNSGSNECRLCPPNTITVGNTFTGFTCAQCPVNCISCTSYIGSNTVFCLQCRNGFRLANGGQSCSL
jgi:hypothetical protein